MRLLAMLLVAAAAIVGTNAAAAEGSTKAIWGPLETHDGKPTLPIYRRLGVDVLQLQLRWDRVSTGPAANPRDPTDSSYRWPSDLDRAVRSSRRYGLKIALLVTGTPLWANGDKRHTYAPINPNDYANFLTAAARRYKRVRHWMIWGEPHRRGAFEPFDPTTSAGPERYANLLDTSYVALKRVRRRNIVIGGMSFTNDQMTPVTFLQWMRLPNGKPPRLDWFGHNPFSVRPPDLRLDTYYPGVRDFSDMDTYLREVRRVYRSIGRRPRLWLSEYTVSSDRPSNALSFFVSRAEQARWLTAAYRIADRHRWIAGLGWFNLQDSRLPNGLTTGLLDVNGRPKPAYYAYRRAR